MALTSPREELIGLIPEIAQRIGCVIESPPGSKDAFMHEMLNVWSQEDKELSGLIENMRQVKSFNIKGCCDNVYQCITSDDNYCSETECENIDPYNPCLPLLPISRSGSNCFNCSVNDIEAENEVGSLVPEINTSYFMSEDGSESESHSSFEDKKAEDHSMSKNNLARILSELHPIVKSVKANKDKKQETIEELKSNTIKFGSIYQESDCRYNVTISQESMLQSNKPLNPTLKDSETITDCYDFIKPITSPRLNVSTEPGIFQGDMNRCNTTKNRIMSLNNIITNNDLKDIYSRLRKQEVLISRTKIWQKLLRDQGKSLAATVEAFQSIQSKDNDLALKLLNKLEELCKPEIWNITQSNEIKNIDERISKIMKKLGPLRIKQESYEKEISQMKIQICQLKRVITEYMKTTDKFISENQRSQNELLEVDMKLSEERKKSVELLEKLAKEKALYDSMEKSYKIHISTLLKKIVDEQNSFMETQKKLDIQLETLQKQNAELKEENFRLKEDFEKLSNDYSKMSGKNEDFHEYQMSIARQKLLTADRKIKEMFKSIEQLLRGIHRRLYENQLEKLKTKCLEQEGIKDATNILGVTPAQMSKVLATEILPNLDDWLETCDRLVYKDHFAEELSSFVLGLIYRDMSHIQETFCFDPTGGLLTGSRDIFIL